MTGMTGWKKAALAVGIGAGVVAVGAGVSRAAGPEGWIGRRVRWARLMRELNVTRDQAVELRAAGVHLAVERKSLDLEGLSPSRRQDRLFELRKQFFARAEEVLTDVQKSKLREKWAEGRQARAQKLEEKLTQTAEKLHLTQEQRRQAREVIRSVRERVRDTMANQEMDEPSRLARAVGVMEEAKGELYRIMTPAQQEQAKGMLEKGLLAHMPRNPLDGE